MFVARHARDPVERASPPPADAFDAHPSVIPLRSGVLAGIARSGSAGPYIHRRTLPGSRAGDDHASRRRGHAAGKILSRH
jgi:hypothetical protein